jgi:hypothetical protein
MQPHIILRMNGKGLFYFLNGEFITSELFGIDTDTLIESDEDGILIFKDFDTARAYQEENTIDGRAVPLPVY